MTTAGKPPATISVEVPVKFTGTVCVDVPADLPAKHRELAARVWALAQVVASLENPDAPQDPAYEDYLDDGGPDLPVAWDQMAGTVSGVWGLGD